MVEYGNNYYNNKSVNHNFIEIVEYYPIKYYIIKVSRNIETNVFMAVEIASTSSPTTPSPSSAVIASMRSTMTTSSSMPGARIYIEIFIEINRTIVINHTIKYTVAMIATIVKYIVQSAIDHVVKYKAAISIDTAINHMISYSIAI